MTEAKFTKQRIKQMFKQEIEKAVGTSLEAHSVILRDLVEQATDAVANTVLDETQIEKIADAAKSGATYVAVNQLIQVVIQDALSQAKPILEKLTQEFEKTVAEALSEAIMEVILERLASIH